MSVDRNGSLQSSDSGIELSASEKIDLDTELTDVTSDDSDVDELVMVESDIDTDYDFERVNSDTELLIADSNEANCLSRWSLNHHFVFDLLVVGALVVVAVSLASCCQRALR